MSSSIARTNEYMGMQNMFWSSHTSKYQIINNKAISFCSFHKNIVDFLETDTEHGSDNFILRETLNNFNQ